MFDINQGSGSNLGITRVLMSWNVRAGFALVARGREEGWLRCVRREMAQITADTSGVHPVVTLTGGCVGIQFKISNRITVPAIGLEQQRFIVRCNGICSETFILVAHLTGPAAESGKPTVKCTPGHEQSAAISQERKRIFCSEGFRVVEKKLSQCFQHKRERLKA